MREWKASLLYKIILWILLALCMASLFGGLAAFAVCSDLGAYSETKEENLTSLLSQANERYSAMALMCYMQNTEFETLTDADFQYGIVAGNDIAEVDLSDASGYLVNHFTGQMPEENAYFFNYEIAAGTEFFYSGEGFWEHCYIYTHSYEYEVEIDAVYYNPSDGILYYYAAGQFYPVKYVELSYFSQEGDDVYCALMFDDAEKKYAIIDFAWTVEDAQEQFLEEEPEEASEEEEPGFAMEEFLEETYITLALPDGTPIELFSEAYSIILDGVDACYLEGQGLVILELPQDLEETIDRYTLLGGEYEVSETSLVVLDSGTAKGETYWVISLLPEEVSYDGNWLNGNMYEKSAALNDLIYRFRYPAVISIAASLAVGSLLFGLLCCAAGHRKNRDGIVLFQTARLPLEVEWGGISVLESLAIIGLELSSEMLDEVEQGCYPLVLIVVGVICVVAGGIFVGGLLNFAARIKAGSWWRNTIVFRLLRLVRMLWRKLTGLCRRGLRLVQENTSLFFRAGFVMVILALFELIIIVSTEYDCEVELFLWFIEKIVLYVILLAALLQLRTLHEGSRRIAEGDMIYRVDTNKMFWEFKKHGENLNNISVGMARAVEERMKSERFKTELITNVSHDIKTPLTSIINYVDLLGKEPLENETAKEYLEVLSRQSGRLKKLIEDLIEASKASTGSLAVNAEQLEAGVFVVQTLGEFEEKTKAQQLELIIKKPEFPVYIMADGRHFWRVIDNLMNNICKYAQPGTRVYINLEPEEREAVLIFRNTSRYALNISSEELMERFVRGDSSRNTEGSGLGLSIARSLMELMDGTLELYVDGDLFKVVLRFPVVK